MAGDAFINALVPRESPLYKAGVAQDDQLLQLGDVPLGSTAAWDETLLTHTPGATVPIRYVRRSGEMVSGTITLDEDPRVDVVPLETTGGTWSSDQQQFRESWLNSRHRR